MRAKFTMDLEEFARLAVEQLRARTGMDVSEIEVSCNTGSTAIVPGTLNVHTATTPDDSSVRITHRNPGVPPYLHEGPAGGFNLVNDRVVARYDARDGALLTMAPVPVLNPHAVSKNAEKDYGAPFMVGESMSRDTARAICAAFNLHLDTDK